jgi:short-subunit dehydrogenase
MDLEGKRALVTGASGGLGGAFARRLAAMGADLVLTGRREEKLRALAAELGPAHGVEVKTVVADLLDPGAPAALFRETEQSGLPVDVLINNAGTGVYGSFADVEWERFATEIQVNVVAMTELAHRFARPMCERRRGHILNMGSIAAYLPSPYLATYAAGKAFMRNFTEALAEELRPAGVRACCLCPGATRTGWFEASGQHDLALLIRATMGSPDRVARVGLKALLGWRRNVVVGVWNKPTAFMLRFLPRRLVVSVTGRVVGAPGS